MDVWKIIGHWKFPFISIFSVFTIWLQVTVSKIRKCQRTNRHNKIFQMMEIQIFFFIDPYTYLLSKHIMGVMIIFVWSFRAWTEHRLFHPPPPMRYMNNKDTPKYVLIHAHYLWKISASRNVNYEHYTN